MKTWDNLGITYHERSILSRVIFKNKEFNLTLFSMAKSTHIEEHTSTREGFIYVIEGRGMFNLGKESIEMKPGIVIYLDKNVAHSLRAYENTSFLLALN